ncbi:hypothetical protein DL96DRAFT_1519771 [Flagelloscypha sp. PMI_526]|nr:hypothetical protein DL96DRAFT_1519771 [Flagelloscypha sp. PMI_526]
MADWEIRWSNSKALPYFFNPATQTSVWDPPSELSEDKIKSLPGAHYLSGHPGQVRASHLLVKHKDSRRPSSWREENITRTKEEAIQILKGYQEEINGDAAKFAELAKINSDCSSAQKGGDLGRFGPGQMQRPFEEATFALKPGEFSDIVSTDSGVHIIYRTE